MWSTQARTIPNQKCCFVFCFFFLWYHLPYIPVILNHNEKPNEKLFVMGFIGCTILGDDAGNDPHGPQRFLRYFINHREYYHILLGRWFISTSYVNHWTIAAIASGCTNHKSRRLCIYKSHWYSDELPIKAPSNHHSMPITSMKAYQITKSPFNAHLPIPSPWIINPSISPWKIIRPCSPQHGSFGMILAWVPGT